MMEKKYIQQESTIKIRSINSFLSIVWLTHNELNTQQIYALCDSLMYPPLLLCVFLSHMLTLGVYVNIPMCWLTNNHCKLNDFMFDKALCACIGPRTVDNECIIYIHRWDFLNRTCMCYFGISPLFTIYSMCIGLTTAVVMPLACLLFRLATLQIYNWALCIACLLYTIDMLWAHI